MLVFGILFFASCGKDNPHDGKVLSVSFTNEEGIYEVKAGRSVTIEPTVTDAVDPAFLWELDGKIVSRELTYAFSSGVSGRYYLTFRIDAANGQYQKEMRIDVLDLLPPKVLLPAEEGYIYAVTGRELGITPDVTHGEGADYRWLLDGREVSSDAAYTFKQESLGDYDLVLIVTNEDGEGRAEATVRVGEVPSLSFFFENENVTVSLGRKVVVTPYISEAASPVYQWKLDGVVQSGQTGSTFSFTPAAEGNYELTVSGTGAENSVSAGIRVTCLAAEGAYRRPATAGSSAYWNKVYEFLAAPGQFINDGYTAATREQAVAYAAGQLAENGYVSLGGFGGYIVVGFDHSIDNTAGYDLAIRGNAHSGSSEPAVVWVMQDENGNGLPDDTWYELQGSETGKPETRQLYAVTYFKPAGSGENVRWTDNYGESGTIDRIISHTQDSYYPNWIATSSYTLRGTYLEARNYDPSGDGSYWINTQYDWGYADNYGSDYVNGETLLELDNAIYPDGTPVSLKYIDFVKVQVAVNAKSGWLGEISTEVCGFRDMNIK